MFALICAALMCATPQDTVRVSASLSADRINIGATTTWRIIVETDGAAPDEIRVPRLPQELEVLGTSDFSQTQLSFPGGRERVTRREIVLVARDAGVYRLPAVVVRIGGRTYRTDALDLVVTAGGAVDPGAPTSLSTSLRVMIEPDTVYVGEQVLLFAEATFAEDMRSRQSRPATFDPPAPTGFWIQDLPDPVSVSLRVREGRTVETQTYRRAYFPLSSGEYRFPPARLYYEVRRGFLYAPETRELESDSVALMVLPLPESGRPASFNGAVGRLSLEASISPQRVAANGAAILTVSLQGSGNVKALPEPHLPAIAGVELFPPTQESRVDIDDDRVGGVKRFKWMLVPEEPGMIAIPPIEYSVFDPELRQYVVLTSDTLRLEVAAFAQTAEGTAASLRPLRTAPGGQPLQWVRAPAFAAVQLIPLVLLFAATMVRRRRSAPAGPKDEVKEIESRLDALLERRDDPQFLTDIERIVCDAVERVAGVRGDPVAGLAAQKRPAAAAELGTLLAELRRLRFAPAEPYDAERLVARVRSFLQMIRPRRRGRSGPAVLVLLLAPALMYAADDGRATFHEGVVLFERGEYAAATNAFRDYTRAQPYDATGWYDLGLAAQRAGDPGRAAWAWLRAVKLAPREADARHNLRAVGAGAALNRVQPIDWLSDAERALIVAALWWVLLLAGSAFVLLERRPRPVALVGVPLMAVALAAIAIDYARPRLIVPLGQGTALFAAPTTRDIALGQLHAGETAQMLELRDGWVRVRAPDGRQAWVERGAVATP